MSTVKLTIVHAWVESSNPYLDGVREHELCDEAVVVGGVDEGRGRAGGREAREVRAGRNGQLE